MTEVHDAEAAHGLIARRASSVAAVLSRLDSDVPLPLVARELARLGVPVFPCAPGGKRPIPERGFHDATIDAGQVEAWWRHRPRANLAIPTGAASGLVVVDIDVHKVDGYAASRNAARSGLLPEPLAIVTTPTGGRHLYYPADAEREQRSWQVGRAGIDFRGDGGYIIVPPSLRAIDGHPASYRVEAVADGMVAPLAAQPLRDFLDPRPKYMDAPEPPGGWPLDVARLASQVARRPEGERNLGLFKASCRMAEHGHSPSEALDALGPAAGQSGLGEREITRTVGSAYRHVSTYGPRRRAPVRQTGSWFAYNASPVSVSGRGL
ncbi:bifunctional DNA primase/polymerase [Propionibacterium freudenreichii]|uniref:bifunctional DNA primase/polymerase n=1 Tax=Propionibacterium freudenreichii TaxID=1744 RepID=UPI000BC2F749|nr:bifunctional DNA primase/polymerase [Propionibacterium freudenreichii]MDK9301715.1 bifunctional DNA primase/polymerase [Propionibacterium freudenreichii]MDK9321120.1 bifunctional DNA primase/polymerase [Propionibacterium freudenreichii]MDK9323533.1 bifunctional DNA primase/polymerase [Propionibacterium freudenreichii]MDK9339793.1 bifunctional DNA primase/polymerase [Propionibacterium freudenreichii]MDK9648499.1 bifunctional DNA primase/polymerase [Propionibacterium freudenreichii]